MPYVPWEHAWREALYGPRGLFRRPASPSVHFRTASTSTVLAQALGRLADAIDAALGHPADFAVVDVGAGRGELLELLAPSAPGRWRLLGVDVVDRPLGLSPRIDWAASTGGVTGLLLGHELLDAIPCPIVECDDAGDVRLVLVEPTTGREKLGGPVEGDDADWLAQWWPLRQPGRRAEVGRSRDRTWRSLVDSLLAGVAMAVDYAHSRAERAGDGLALGTLASYRDGVRIPALPDGSCDLTAHVALDACAAATPADGWTLLTAQADALRALGVSAILPSTASVATKPEEYVARLQAAGAARTLLDPAGPGGFGWLLHGRGLPELGMMRR